MRKNDLKLPLLFVALALMSACSDGESASIQNLAQTDSTLRETETAVELIIPVSAEDILKLVSESDKKAVLVNVWATWCQPCVEEFPELLRIRSEYRAKGVELMLVSADFEDEMAKLREFLNANNVDFKTYFKVQKDEEFINAFESEWSGALPVTFLFDSSRNLVRMWNEKISYESLSESLNAVLAN